MRITFFLKKQKKLFGAKQLLQITIYQTLFDCLIWSKKLKFSQIIIFVQTLIVTKHSQVFSLFNLDFIRQISLDLAITFSIVHYCIVV